ncbi:LLM class flavin-dependent oxidoreductase [Pseudonocardia dioxanivorans]|uniref:LLM class flavin-dependent oxidoreductase n=1 Tax=Pseudonocardia dioxanivorans TaxID=240495 RepID=UPI000CD2F4EA|nr:LLM class flavin-dependent oxidoreductase [Pseudonocardia dioxanivorans]
MEIILTATVMGLGMHHGAWRYRDGDAFDYVAPDYYAHIARTAEAGALHAIFLADTLDVSEERFARPNLGALDPAVTLAVMAAHTERIGLVGTSSTTFNEPFNLARRFASLDHMSRGRAGWNAVTTFVPAVAGNFGGTPLPAHDQRYARAREFLDVVIGLWESWEADATVGDKASGVFVDAARVRTLDHVGEHFSVRGPSTLPRSRQGRPVIFQAGASEGGRDLAAQYADVVFTAQNTIEAATAFRTDVRRRAVGYGRSADAVKIVPGLLPVVGSTTDEARARKEKLDELRGVGPELEKLALRVGVPVEALELDEPLPVDLIRANEGFRGSHGFRDAAVELATRKKLTVRELLYANGGGHQQVVGTPEEIADTIETWVEAGAVDGFNLMIDAFPSGLEDVVEHVVPLLRKRCLFQHEYAGSTLRTNLGLPPLPNRS